MRALRHLAAAAALSGLGVAGVTAQTDPAPLAVCDDRLRVQPQAETAARCFLEAAHAGDSRQEAARRLAMSVERHPDLPWPRYYLGRLSIGEPAVDNLKRARDLFTAQGDGAAAFAAQLHLVRKLDFSGWLEEAAAELATAWAMRPANDELADAQIRLVEAALATSRGDLDEAYATLTDVKGHLIPGGPDEFREELFYRLGFVLYELGQIREAAESLERAADINRARGNRYREAADLYMSATWTAAESGADDRERVVEQYRKALAAAQTVGRTSVVAKSHLQLAKLAATSDDARRHLDACLEVADETEALTQALCLGARAYERRADDPAAARQDLERAFEIARAAEDPWPSIYLWSERLPVSWATRERPLAIAESLAALEEIEKLRDAWLDDSASAQYFSVWAPAYGWLAGQLLASSGPPHERQELEQAFATIERYRARVLIERLQEIGAWTELPESRQDDVRSPPAPLAEVEEALRRNEALLVFQLGDWRDIYGRFGGGSWLLAVTASGTRVYRLGGRRELERRVEELIDPEKDRDAAVADEVYRGLVAPALDELPSDVDRLFIVPDGRLHRLPFGTLGPAGEAPLALGYQISLLPSADFWLRWRRAAAGAEGPVLVLADPARPAPAAGEDPREGRRDGLGAGARWCRRLPYAREEGRAIVREAGGASVLRLGEQASEQFVKHADLRPFGVIHIASHTHVDERRSERSLVCLAAGGPGEDGDLKAHEIVQLRLEGQLVVLASCAGARGPALSGEGVMSLARAFFLAGARTVVASLQRIDDAEARDLFVRFHRHLVAGRSVAAALQAAQREIYEEQGASAAFTNTAWANMVVLGDGSWTPLVPRSRLSWPVWTGTVIMLYLLSIGIRVWRLHC